MALWVERIRAQVAKYVDFTGDNAARIVNNLDWTGPLSVLDFLRDIGKHFPVNRMLAREVVRTRLEEGISYTEFSPCFFNRWITWSFTGHTAAPCSSVAAISGAISRPELSSSGVWKELVHAMATPLLTKADGSKFGKTESGTIWLDPAMTSPYALHQFFLNAEDEKVVDYLKVFSDRGYDEITELERQTREAPQLRAAQRALADDVTVLVHGPAGGMPLSRLLTRSSAAPISANCQNGARRRRCRNWRCPIGGRR